MADATLFLGEVWTATDDAQIPFASWQEGGVVVDGDVILDVGDGQALKQAWPDAIRRPFTGVLLPGFIDTHVHFPQLDIIGSYGEELLGWLDTYTYPAEAKFDDPAIARAKAPRFFKELLANGTTTAAVYATTQQHVAEALFEEAKAMNLTMVIGKVSMDREGPAALLQDWQTDAKANEELISRYHEYEQRLFCALTPRFAIACSEDLLRSLGRIAARHPSVYIQTHHAENMAEVEYTKQLFPQAAHYLAVYEQFGLLTERTILGHSIYITDEEIRLLQAKGACIAHCPTSNAFLGSGLFPWQEIAASHIPISLATDVGAGTSLSMWRTMAMAYKIQSLRGTCLTPEQLFYHATLGGAKVLHLDYKLGRIAPGFRADFQIIDPARHRLLGERFASGQSSRDGLFACIILGDDRITTDVFVGGKPVPLPG